MKTKKTSLSANKKRRSSSSKRTSSSRYKKIKQKASLATDRLKIAKQNKGSKSGKRLKAKRSQGKKKFFSPKVMRRIRKGVLITSAVFFIFFVVGALWFFSYLQALNDELPTPEDVFPNDLALATEIYDRFGLEGDDEGELLYRVINQDYNSDPVDIETIPEYVQLAFIAAEDESFYDHNGFDPAAITRCALRYLRDPDNLCGGSTITQQLVKITSLGNEQRVERKLKELLLATKVEQASTKDEILQMYLQVAPFGSNIYGINTAAEFYFGKEPSELTLAEAAVLASIIQNPVQLSPTKGLPDPETAQAKVKDRQEYVLGQLEDNMKRFNDQIRKNSGDLEMDDVLTQELIDEAFAQEMIYEEPIATDKKAGHFVDYVLDQLTTRNYKNGEEPFDINELRSGGYKVYTTLDYQIQTIAEGYAKRAGNDYDFWNVHNAAVLTVAPGTGEVIAMAGSKDFYGTSEGCNENGAECLFNPQVNALTSTHSPGSTNKSLGYYMAYKEGLLFPGSFLPDVPMNIGSYTPRNWNNTFNGVNYTAEQALRDSRNIPALFVAEMVGYENYVNTAREFGYTTYTQPDGNYGHSVILGGADVTPVEHAQAHGVFANGGDFVQLDPILRIEDKDGNVVYEAEPIRRQIGDPQAVWLLNQTIKNYDGFSWDGRELAGKTGTTEENKDAWFVGYSPDFVTVGWVGNNNNSPMDPNYGYPPNVVIPWLKDYMRDIGEAPYFSAKTPFEKPGFVYEGGGDCTDGKCLGLKSSWLIVDREPPRRVQQSKVTVCTDQKDKLARPQDISLGFAEEVTFNFFQSPVADWQNFIDEYMGIKFSENPGENTLNGGPSEYCDRDRTGGVNGPFFSISQPARDSVITDTLNVSGSIFTSEGSIASVDFFFAGQAFTGSSSNYSNFNEVFNIGSLGLENGTYTFTIRATDTQGITNEFSTQVIVGTRVSPNMSFTQTPPSPLAYGVTVNPTTHNIQLQYTGGSAVSAVELYQVKNGSETTLLGNMTDIGGGVYSAAWGSGVPDESASYRFYVVMRVNGGYLQSENSSEVLVNL